MDTKNNNIAINEFSGGMNSDLSYSVLHPNQYIYGKNIRITSNSLLDQTEVPDKKEGVVSLIPEGVLKYRNTNTYFKSVLATAHIDDICVIIIRTITDKWAVYRITNYDVVSATKIFEGGYVVDSKNFSVVINKEVNGVIKLYIADGTNQIMVLNINQEYDLYNQTIPSEQYLVSNSYFPANKINIINKISGRLPVGQVQYTYRFYKKYGIKSRLAPLTNKIQIFDSERNKEEGNAEGTISSVGLQLQIQCDPLCAKLFDKIQIFRVYYKHPNTDADIELIYDNNLSTTGGGAIRINDIGQDSLKTYSAEEFSLLDGQIITPNVIEQNQGYMFAANVNDETMFRPEQYGFDAKSYSMNSNNNIELYYNEDQLYQLDPAVNEIYSVVGSGDVHVHNTLHGNTTLNQVFSNPENYNVSGDLKQYTINKFSDLNYVKQNNDDPCRYSLEVIETQVNGSSVQRHILGGSGQYVDWRFITTNIPVHEFSRIQNCLPPAKSNVESTKIYYIAPVLDSNTGLENHNQFEPIYFQYSIKQDPQSSDVPSEIVTYAGQTTDSYFQQHGILAKQNISYDEMFTSSMLRSLRRDEVYRYGIILYDKSGKRSDVNWIADIRTPNNREFGLISSRPLAIADISTEHYISTYTLATTYRQDAFKNRYGDHSNIYTYSGVIQSQNFSIDAGNSIYIKDTSNTASINIEQQYEYYRYPGSTALRSMFTVSQITSTIDQISQTVISRLAQEQNSKLGAFSITIDDIRICFEQDNGIIETDIRTYNESYKDATRIVWVKIYYTQQVAILSVGYRLIIDTDLRINLYVYSEQAHPINEDSAVCVRPIGIEFKVHNLPSDVVGYQIVRCAKNQEYRKNIMQCVVARPARQLIHKQPGQENEILSERYSPYYPSYILTSNGYTIVNNIPNGNNDRTYVPETIYDGQDPDDKDSQPDWSYEACALGNDSIFQLYSPEITFRRQDALQSASNAKTMLFFGYYYQYGGTAMLGINRVNDNWNVIIKNLPSVYEGQEASELLLEDDVYYTWQRNKTNLGLQYCYYNYTNLQNQTSTKIKQIQDVKNPLWYDAYSNIEIGGDGISSATKKYQSYVTAVGNKEYLNWVCNAMYGIKAFQNDINGDQTVKDWQIITKQEIEKYINDEEPSPRTSRNTGFVGPGPICFIADTENTSWIESTAGFGFGSAVVNLQHTAVQYAGKSNAEKEFDVYYGFGNFKNIKNGSTTMMMFDGDVYIVPFEIVQMFKTYDFNSVDTLQSAQFVYYVPIESPINTFLDYGMNYRNTFSKNLQLEPGEITGVAVQDRPLHQYNSIMSDNSISNDIYNARSSQDQVLTFNQRIFFSDPKISGEYIDSWLNFAPLNYIDVDSRYGDITCLHSLKDTIYCWQERAFGRISVKEKSLVSDTNSNMIQLGQGGVMQRIDYIDTIHGMSADQYVCTSANGRVFWIDDKNRSVLMSDGQTAVNLSERAQVQSILNHKFYNKNMKIDYDAQTDELLCKCLQDGNQIVFNTKLGIATSEYTRRYDSMLLLNNSLHGINTSFEIYKYSNLTKDEITNMMPASITFVVNNNASITKVFDNQEIVLSNITNNVNDFSENVNFAFGTNLEDMNYSGTVNTTSREGNIQYAIPRSDNAIYGQRMRGKWLKVKINNNGKMTEAISHIMTKFRQSF